MDEARGSADWWDARYLSGDTPWDTGIVPPEIVALIESGLSKRGWALDLGCGSGLSSRYLARHGFQVVGLDLARAALTRGCHAARAEGLPAYFCLADVSDLSFLAIKASLAVDVGCFHSIPCTRRAVYIASLARHLVPGALYLLYAFEPSPGQRAEDDDPSPVGAGDLALFAPFFVLRWSQHGRDRQRLSAWYLLQRA